MTDGIPPKEPDPDGKPRFDPLAYRTKMKALQKSTDETTVKTIEAFQIRSAIGFGLFFLIFINMPICSAFIDIFSPRVIFLTHIWISSVVFYYAIAMHMKSRGFGWPTNWAISLIALSVPFTFIGSFGVHGFEIGSGFICITTISVLILISNMSTRIPMNQAKPIETPSTEDMQYLKKNKRDSILAISLVAISIILLGAWILTMNHSSRAEDLRFYEIIGYAFLASSVIFNTAGCAFHARSKGYAVIWGILASTGWIFGSITLDRLPDRAKKRLESKGLKRGIL